MVDVSCGVHVRWVTPRASAIIADGSLQLRFPELRNHTWGFSMLLPVTFTSHHLH